MKKILIIDDERITETLCTNLALLGFNTLLMQDYRNIDNELKNKYDAIILDVIMPILDSYFSEEEIEKAHDGLDTGIVLFDKIRKQYPKLPIVFYSARSGIYCDECTAFISKPVMVQSIAKIINDLIEKVSNL